MKEREREKEKDRLGEETGLNVESYNGGGSADDCVFQNGKK